MSDSFSDDDDMLRVRKGIYIQGNKLITQFRQCSEEVKVKLFQTYFSSFYGMILWSSFKNDSKSIIVTAYKKIYRKFFNISEQ